MRLTDKLTGIPVTTLSINGQGFRADSDTTDPQGCITGIAPKFTLSPPIMMRYPGAMSLTDFTTTCDLFDAHEAAARVISLPLRDFGKRRLFSGVVATVKCFEDNSRVKEAAATDGRGKVMVVDGGGSCRVALMGDLIAQEALRCGWAGIVIYGCVRDSAVLKRLDLGIKAIATTPRKSVRRGVGLKDIPLHFGETWINPGDYLFADEDGVLLLADS